MKRESRALEAYIQAVLPERERWLYQHALNKTRVITRAMSAAEKAEYLNSEAFQSTLRQLQRRDRVWQGLLRGELVLSGDRAEFDRLEKLIEAEGKAGRKIDLAFLRTVEKSRVSLEKAYEARRIVRDGELRKFFDDNIGQLTNRAENRVVLWLRTGDQAARLGDPEGERFVIRRVMETGFPGGLTHKAVNRAFQPGSLGSFLRNEAGKAMPELAACRNVKLPSGETVANAVRREAERSGRMILNALEKKFSRERIRRLLEKNPGLIRLQKEADAVWQREKQIRAALLDAIPEHYRDLYPLARQMKRHFYLHLGPTNSGKTYEGVQRLHGAECGVYLGPLRLLAAEQFEALNLDDVPCSLVTGEEQIRVPFSRVQSSTVEMADLKTRYDVAVIDECQMIADRDRGGAWTAAILGLCAEEIHACASPDAEQLLTRIIEECGDELTVIRHERMTPLEVETVGFQFPNSVQPGDALIVFSKARVHAVAAERRGHGQTADGCGNQADRRTGGAVRKIRDRLCERLRIPERGRAGAGPAAAAAGRGRDRVSGFPAGHPPAADADPGSVAADAGQRVFLKGVDGADGGTGGDDGNAENRPAAAVPVYLHSFRRKGSRPAGPMEGNVPCRVPGRTYRRDSGDAGNPGPGELHDPDAGRDGGGLPEM